MQALDSVMDKEEEAVTRAELSKKIPLLSGKEVLIVGDIMLDQYIFGSVERISPEAPVPVVVVEQEEYRLGGASNVARNVAALGGKCMLMGYIGTDAAGRRMRDMLDEHGIDHACIEVKKRPTTTKTRIIAQQQQIVRVDREACTCQGLHGCENMLRAVRKQAEKSSVIIISDYGKGLVSADFMREIMKIRDSSKKTPTILVDPKPKNFSAYTGVDLLTPNSKEAGIEGMETSTLNHIAVAGRSLRHRLRTEKLLITLGPRGMMLFEGDNKCTHIPTAAKKVFDVTGAGDTVIAVLGLALASGLTTLQGSLLANYAAGLVVGQVGAAVVDQKQLAEAVKSWPRLQLEHIRAE